MVMASHSVEGNLFSERIDIRFKLHLRPRTQTTSSVDEDIPPLPPGKSAVDVLADFLVYMKQCARTYIVETHPVDGANFWRSGKEEYILSHPNAWEGAQQTLIRRAAVQAGLISDTPADHARINFITEGEASLNFCIERGLMNDSIRHGHGVTVVDAGGGTIDVSTYAKRPSGTDKFGEIAAAQSCFKGSVFVTRAAAGYLDECLLNTRFHGDVPSMARKFDRATKLHFRDPKDPQFIWFGNVSDRDPDKNIQRGRLKLDGSIVANFFEPSIEGTVDTVLNQVRLATKPVTSVFLVGGFAANDYFFSELEKRLRPHRLDIYRPDPYFGSRWVHCRLFASLCTDSRIPVHVWCTMRKELQHIRRMSQSVRTLGGNRVIPGAFSDILLKNTEVTEIQEFWKSYRERATSRGGLSRQNQTPITCYRGNIACPQFFDQDPGNFHSVFSVHADLSGLVDNSEERTGPVGAYYEVQYDIIILFGLTESKAQYAWTEEGVERRGPAEVVFDTEIEYRD
ncbi:hypothetical protein P691DRAFT_758690 [Macrolepiota fuliginosa MF-IS2]|uniref:Actin-like ATPase domain-containing protein n=1 Tax=Macrolepiota fuliginosa MF-IS2 TaxID=1400762 RepID=A0A9P6C2R3_9AGAR|nr:hypothetical protein P691DRAFT_758690 [Macrolepiota fuliginosa MF-IS2]